MDMREIRFGVEIETVKRTREQVARAIHSVVGGTIRHAGYPATYDPWEVEELRGRKGRRRIAQPRTLPPARRGRDPGPELRRPEAVPGGWQGHFQLERACCRGRLLGAYRKCRVQ
jgi:hypothetical protein